MIVTSYLFPDGKFALDRLEGLENKVGREKLIVDISCRRREDGWVVAMNGWKTLTDMWVTKGMSYLFLCQPYHVGRESDCGMGDIKKQGLDFKVRWDRGTGTHSSIQVVHGGHVISVSENKDLESGAS